MAVHYTVSNPAIANDLLNKRINAKMKNLFALN